MNKTRNFSFMSNMLYVEQRGKRKNTDGAASQPMMISPNKKH